MEGTGRSRMDGDRNAETERLIEELREAVRARDEFVAIAAHELRNPMTPILIQLHLLRAAADDPARCVPETIVPRLERLQAAIQEFLRRSTVLLDLSRIAQGNIRIEAAKVDLSALVEGVIASIGLPARKVGCTLQTDVHPGVLGMWDPLALEQVVENLLSNAIKFGAGKPVFIRVRRNGQSVEITVRDQGVGISEEDRKRIFERFERAVTQRQHGGFGIGLWLANQLVMAMAGSIHVESAPGQGTSFVVTLPCAETEQQKGSTG